MSREYYEINIKKLAQVIGAFDDEVKEECKKIQGQLTVEVLRNLLLATPVDTGRLRAGWVPSVGAPSDFVPDERARKKGDRAGIHGAEGRENLGLARNIAAELKNARFGTKSYVVNNVPYINHVNDRHPSKAGFIEAAVENAYSRFI